MDTNRFSLARSALVAAFAAAALGSCARESGPTPAAPADGAQAACLPQVHDGWVRLAPGGMAMHGGFGRIANPCATAATITGARSPAYGDVSLHETTLDEGISRMRPLSTLTAPAHGEVVLRPGGLHLMLMQPQVGLAPGDRVEIAFRLADGREVRGTFDVRAANAL